MSKGWGKGYSHRYPMVGTTTENDYLYVCPIRKLTNRLQNMSSQKKIGTTLNKSLGLIVLGFGENVD